MKKTVTTTYKSSKPVKGTPKTLVLQKRTTSTGNPRRKKLA